MLIINADTEIQDWISPNTRVSIQKIVYKSEMIIFLWLPKLNFIIVFVNFLQPPEGYKNGSLRY